MQMSCLVAMFKTIHTIRTILNLMWLVEKGKLILIFYLEQHDGLHIFSQLPLVFIYNKLVNLTNRLHKNGLIFVMNLWKGKYRLLITHFRYGVYLKCVHDDGDTYIDKFYRKQLDGVASGSGSHP